MRCGAPINYSCDVPHRCQGEQDKAAALQRQAQKHRARRQEQLAKWEVERVAAMEALRRDGEAGKAEALRLQQARHLSDKAAALAERQAWDPA